MAVDIEAALGEALPGAAPPDLMGPVIAAPIATTAADMTILSRACTLMGWSIREATGASVAIAEWFDGSGPGGTLLGCSALTPATDAVGEQSPAASSQSGANVALVASIGGVAGTTVFIQSLRITGLGATAATEVTATLTGVQGGTINYPISVPAGVAVPIANIEDSWPGRGLSASASGQAIALNVPAFGAGNALAEAEIAGYVLNTVGDADTQWFGPIGILVRVSLTIHPVVGSVRGAAWIRR